MSQRLEQRSKRCAISSTYAPKRFLATVASAEEKYVLFCACAGIGFGAGAAITATDRQPWP